MFCKDKHARPGPSNTFLGVVFNFAQFRATGRVITTVAQSKIDKVKAMVQHALSTRLLPYEVAASLAGKVRYCTTWAVGRFGRAAMQPLYVRANFRRPWGRRAARLSPILYNSLEFFASMFARSLKRSIFVDPATRERPVLVWSDAMWSAEAVEPARLGFVVVVPEVAAPDGTIIETERWLYSHEVVDRVTMAQLADREQYITQLEVMAAVAVYTSIPDELRSRDVIHWIDNTGALAVLAKAYSTEIDIAKLLHAFELANLNIRATPYFEYVRSKANIADLPSRGDLDYVINELGAVYVPTVLPSLEGWQGGAQHSSARKRSRKTKAV